MGWKRGGYEGIGKEESKWKGGEFGGETPAHTITLRYTYQDFLFSLQIKYCVRSAIVLAEQSGELLTASHFETVLDLAEEFERELELGDDGECFDSDDERD